MLEAILRPRRSVLYMPGSNAKAMDKAKSLGADSLIFDLEDAVAPEAKAQAREAVAAALRGGGYGAREVIVRVNGLATPWGRDDLAAIVPAGPGGVLFPKVDGPGDVTAARAAMLQAGAAPDLPLLVMIETPKALLALREIGQAAKAAALVGFVMGTNDLAKDLRAVLTPDRAAFLTALSMAVITARAYGLAAIDGVFNDIQNQEGFAGECRQGLQLGFDGKTLIHPAQIETANRIFSPSAQEINWAHAVIAAFAAPENAGRGVLKVDGRMIELLHLAQAKRLAATAAHIAALENRG